nr:uncharacterized protein K02A2.6-like [Lepeophtheirus salmonis]
MRTSGSYEKTVHRIFTRKCGTVYLLRKNARGRLILVDNCRIIVPRKIRIKVLEGLHEAHLGISRGKERSRTLYYFQKDISQKIQTCEKCHRLRNSQPAETIIDEFVKRPYEVTSVYIFEYAGKYFQVYVDRSSGWPSVIQFHKAPNTNNVAGALKGYMMLFGILNRLRPDGGTQYKSIEFKELCNSFKIKHKKSSLNYPQSNGHAEAAVKGMKDLVKNAVEMEIST